MFLFVPQRCQKRARSYRIYIIIINTASRRIASPLATFSSSAVNVDQTPGELTTLLTIGTQYYLKAVLFSWDLMLVV